MLEVMPNWVFVISILILGYILIYRLHHWKPPRWFKSPDTSLTWFTIFVLFAMVVQQVSGYRHGVFYILSDSATRAAINELPSKCFMVTLLKVFL
jgi:hypothetical protein